MKNSDSRHLRSRFRRTSAALVLASAGLWGAVGCSAGAPSSDGMEGEVQVFYLEHQDGGHDHGYALKTATGETLELRFANDPDLRPGTLIRVFGVETIAPPAERKVGAERIEVDSFEFLPSETGTAAHSQALATGGPRTVQVALLVLNIEGGATPLIDRNTAEQRLQTVRDYYDELSWGNWQVEGEAFGPLTIPQPTDCGMETIRNAGLQAAQAAGISLSQFDHVGFIIPPNSQSGLNCDCAAAWGANAPATQVPTISTTTLYADCVDPNAFTHELGHAFGLAHAETLSCGSQPYASSPYTSCTLVGYGNKFNTLGNGLGHMNAFQKSAMKWLDQCNGQRVRQDGEFTLTAIQQGTTALQALQIPTGDTHNGMPLYFYVEYRNPALATFNTALELTPSVHVTVAQDFTKGNGDTRSALLDLGQPMNNHRNPGLTAGRSFQDPLGRVTISVLSTTTEEARIRVQFADGGSGENRCWDGSIPGVPAPAAVELSEHCGFDGWQLALPEGDYTTADLAGPEVVRYASSLKVADGYEAILYDGDNFTGRSVVITGSSSCLVDQNINDSLASLRVRKVPTVDVFTDCSFGGTDRLLAVGDYDAARLAELGLNPDVLSSLIVPPGIEVDLFDGDSFTGDSVTLTANSTCLHDQGFNDRVNSLRVRTVGN